VQSAKHIEVGASQGNQTLTRTA